jgi:hypothetical protein
MKAAPYDVVRLDLGGVLSERAGVREVPDAAYFQHALGTLALDRTPGAST